MADVKLTLNTFDEHGNVTGTKDAMLSQEQIADIIDHAVQLSVVQACADAALGVFDELESALSSAGLIEE